MRTASAAIVETAVRDRGADGLWPVHPRDDPEDPPRSYTGAYIGAAGVVWALRELGADGDWGMAAAGLGERYLAQPDANSDNPASR